jgi:hypothetical protein
MAVTIPTCLRVVPCLRKARSCVVGPCCRHNPLRYTDSPVSRLAGIKPQARLRSVDWQGFFSSCMLVFLATTPCGLVVISMFLRNILPTFHFNPEEGGVIFLRKLVSTYKSTQRHSPEDQHAHISCRENRRSFGSPRRPQSAQTEGSCSHPVVPTARRRA